MYFSPTTVAYILDWSLGRFANMKARTRTTHVEAPEDVKCKDVCFLKDNFTKQQGLFPHVAAVGHDL